MSEGLWVPGEHLIGPVDGFVPVMGIESRKRQLYVPGTMHKYETLLAADMLDTYLLEQGIDHVDDVIGLSRGGMAIGAELSYANDYTRVNSLQVSGYDEYNKPYADGPRIVRIPDKRMMSRGGTVIIADDLIDSGKAMAMAVEWVQKNLKPKHIFTVVLYTKDRDRVMDADVSVRYVRNEWHDYAVQANSDRRKRRVLEMAPYAGVLADMYGRLEMQPVDREWWLDMIARSAGVLQFKKSKKGDSKVTMDKFVDKIAA